MQPPPLSSQASIDRLWQLVVFSLAFSLLLQDMAYYFWQLVGLRDLIQPNGIPLGSDFISVWSAGYLAALGRPEAAYDNAALFAAHQVAIPANKGTFGWFYPPMFQLVALPLGKLPYLVALPLYSVLKCTLFFTVLWKLRPKPGTLLLAASFQGTWLCLLSGQNGMLTAALFGVGLLWLERRPALAGAILGLVSYKPQLALQLPVATLAGRHWKPILAAVATAAALALSSLFILGLPVWQTFLATASRSFDILRDGGVPMSHMISTFASLWMMKLPHSLAHVEQALTALAGAVAVFWLWRKPDISINLKGAGLVFATLLTSPHLFQYELPLAGLGLLFLWKEAEQTGWKKYERPLLVFSWLSPPFLPFVLYPLLFLVLLAVTVTRAKAPAAAAR